VSDGPIHSYLRELRSRVPGGPLRRRRVLGELRAHLEDAAEKEQKAGRTHEEAERLAVERFGVPFADRQRRWATRIAPPVVAGVIVAAAVAVALESRGNAGKPQAQSPPIPYSSVPLCGSAGSGATPAGSTATAANSRRERILLMACRPRPAVAAQRFTIAAIGRLPDGATVRVSSLGAALPPP
jgi:negative regulator of sigma E activity